MNIIEYGKENTDVILLLHGGGLSWWNYKEAAQLLAERFHVVIPILNGHGGCDAPFTTIEEQAEELVAYIEGTFAGHVLLLGGVSLGGQILLEMLSQKGDLCSFAVVESASVVPMKLPSKWMEALFAMSYPLMKKRWFSKLQFRSLHMKPAYFDDYYADTMKIAKADLCAFLTASGTYCRKESLSRCNAKVLVAVGGKEQIRMKKSAKLIAAALRNAKMTVLEGLYHGELSLNHPKQYSECLLKFINES